jgi:hypothetical protein
VILPQAVPQLAANLHDWDPNPVYRRSVYVLAMVTEYYHSDAVAVPNWSGQGQTAPGSEGGGVVAVQDQGCDGHVHKPCNEQC